MSLFQSIGESVLRWFDTGNASKVAAPTVTLDRSVNWGRVIPFIFLHLSCLFVIEVGYSVFAVVFAILMYLIRMFAITAFYHRYFSHRAFKTYRLVQFIFGLIGAAATQRGPLWWAANHRDHHRYSDTEKDIHSPREGFFWSHMGWFLSDVHFSSNHERIKDFTKYPELLWLDRFDLFVPVFFAAAILSFGYYLEFYQPSLGVTAWQLLIWGYFISTVVLIHTTLCINSLAHRFGSRRFATKDNSRNNFLLAIITLGEGWHNNHHHYSGSAKQGFYWWEIDITYYLLKFMACLGLVWDLRPVPEKVLHFRRETAKKELA